MPSPSKPRSKAYRMNIEAFIREFGEHAEQMENKRFCFLLGAGASKASGISLGSELAQEWLKELHQREAKPNESFEEWATADNLHIEGFTLKEAGNFYTQIFERRFEGEMDSGQFWLERKFGKAVPSPGYYFLAQILHGSKHKVVVTTNFDNLAADTVLQLTGNLPRIISDARIARYLNPQPRLPIIAKVHGDIGFATTINTTDGVTKLDEEWKEPLRRIFSNYTPIIIGWEGNDGSLMDFLTTEMVDNNKVSELPAGIYWCYRPEKTWEERIASNPKLQKLCQVHTVHFIAINSFDEVLHKLAKSLNLADPLTKLHEQQKQRSQVFMANLLVEANRIDKAVIGPDAPAKTRKNDSNDLRAMVETHEALQEGDPSRRLERLRATVRSYPEDATPHAALALELHKQKQDPDEAEVHYQKAIQLKPRDASILGNYANFLVAQRKQHDRAEEYYLKALAADPNHANNLGNYANFLQKHRKEGDKAEEYYLKALAVDPNHTDHLGNYAVYLQNQRKDYDKAEEYYLKALAADPNHATHLGNYANFLQNQRKDDDKAEEYYLKALAANPNNATHLGNYAIHLQNQRKDDDKAEGYYLQAIAADPNHATHLGNYANFLQNQRKNDDKAEEYYLKALAANPNNAGNIGAYANFLETQRNDQDQAEDYYLKALVADPNHVAVLGNYANFLKARRKDDDKADEYYLKALAADPNHAGNLGNYANFLQTQRKNDDKAEEYYLKALTANPNHANNLGNYAQFLIGRGKLSQAQDYANRAWNQISKWNQMLTGEVAFSLWLLAAMAGKEETTALGRLKTLLKAGYSRSPWSFDAMLAHCVPQLPAEKGALARKLAAAILDESKLQELEADPLWKKVKPLPLDPSWPSEGAEPQKT